ncbi:MAG: hypothetical protein IID54_06385 [Proteobacteria bacterium]|nr:hypothetical protein [Pseudomonadota bacterium]
MQAWVFVLGVIFCWGVYGPALHMGQSELGSGLRVLLCVGATYFLVAVLVPLIIMSVKPEPGAFTMKGVAFATLGGVLGAAGATCIIFAFKSGGSPLWVMPLVFGGAPVINAITSMIQHPPKTMPSPIFWAGLAMAACGAFIVMKFKPI